VTPNVRSKPKARGDAAVELAHLGVVAVEELEERGLRARRALDAAETQRGFGVLELLERLHEVLDPQRRALADRRRLRGLVVRESERRQRAVLARETRQLAITLTSWPRRMRRPSRIWISSVLSVTKQLVAPRCRIARAFGATSP
jgi:hypothetical protein